jgi:hypothetical protein
LVLVQKQEGNKQVAATRQKEMMEVIECDTKLRLLNDSRRLMAPAAARADSRAVPVECRRPEMLDLTSEPFHPPLTFGSPSSHLFRI